MTGSLLDRLGRVDNLSDPEPILNSKAAIFGVVLSFLIISSAAAYGRLWIRIFITRAPGWDDVFVFLSMLSNIAAAAILCVLGARGGLGQHFLLLGIDGMGRFLQTLYVANGIYPMSTAFVKLALLFQYLRCFDQDSPRLRLATIVAIVVVSLWGFAFTFIAFFPCFPVRAFWDLTIPSDGAVRWGYCAHDTLVFVETYVGHAASNMFLDLLVFALPISLCLRSGVETRTRKALIAIFLLGTIVNVCSVLRLIALIDTQAGTYPTLDPSWYGCTPIVLSALEVHLATICASLPVFWPMIKDVISSRSITVTHEVEITRETRDFGSWHLGTYEMEPRPREPRNGHRKKVSTIKDADNDRESLFPHPSTDSEVVEPRAYDIERTITGDGASVNTTIDSPPQKSWIEHQLGAIDGNNVDKIDLDLGTTWKR